ncbi:MAG TPA: DUF1343 domain-containing protein [Candidatus Polarisedimenticolaceae bacterium]|nr:DUF1343 domain-containing protein [Candidatus Polarisedimenticolaceae bacterium]
MSRVRTGLESFLDPAKGAAGLARGARLGVVAHPASIDAGGRHLVDRLISDGRFRVVRLFGPEHGVRGEAQDMESVGEAVDRATGLPVVSLYGDTEASLRPTPEHLRGLDAIVYDLQDVGSRYYTFVYTLSFVMEAARDARIPVVVLDRPNPIGGLAIEGPVLEPEMASFVGRFPVPVRHGLTTGELAHLFRDHFGIGGDVRVVPMTGWTRAQHFEETGLPWVLPSPNMPTPDTARLYPGGCLVEGTNLSEGRGTTRPFELVGAPWLDAATLAEMLAQAGDAEGLDGVMFRAASFRPMFQKHAGRTCGGVQVHVTDRDRARPFATYLVLLREIRALAPDLFDWRRERYEFVDDRLAIDLLLGLPGLRPMIESRATLAEMEAVWSDGLARFLEIREPFLLYPS